MKPLVLQGHERSITQIKYNRQGDLLFSAAKDPNPSVWFSSDGERLGTFSGHRGTVWSIDTNWDSSKLVTGSGDLSCRIWDVENGNNLMTFEAKSAVRSSNFSYCGNSVCYTTDHQMGQQPQVVVVDVRSGDEMLNFNIETKNMAKPMCSLWGELDSYIVTGHDDGALCKWDIKTGGLMNRIRTHTSLIRDMQVSTDHKMLLTASKDKTAKLFHLDSLALQKTYTTERPVNSAAISPTRDHIVLGGGQDAMDVTTTSTKANKFDARFFHLVFQEEFARVRGHFGPINSLVFNPDGNSFASGGEDGFIRVHTFDKDYMDFEMEF